ncbi:hypothetical protein CEUSTIGMA_g8640.t1 [Chlamydomonas eustigma]|uniref:Cytochrome P450 n=1 Tax=Chlamydomonas eustigma TaxID=1157962 RepID=A0A250XDP3_9CHLO|nr:hypothetical protein CEUSTIGMA_g8640.t1 [Chlamydomonas eustigma]|eukprot:GAX81208.1 hypothetical protein CEUSTIGMA_g8640.t1 [Chlamydomonas eustigma]
MSLSSNLMTTALLVPALKTVSMYLALCIVVLLLLLILNPERILQEWKLRHIPGHNPNILLGHLPTLIKYGSPNLYMKLSRDIGSVFKVWWGRLAFVVITDPEIIRSVGYKCMDRITVFGALLEGDLKKANDEGLVVVKERSWRTLHRAWQPAFHPSTLSGYLGLMDQCARDVVKLVLEQAEQQGEGRVDIHSELGKMTMQVVGTCAYGVDFKALVSDQKLSELLSKAKQPDFKNRNTILAQDFVGPTLTDASRKVFRSGSIANGSKWMRINVLLPEVSFLVKPLAFLFPDKPMKEQLKARFDLYSATSHLISSWKSDQAAAAISTGTSCDPPSKCGDPPSTGLEHQVLKGVNGGVAPGSFLGLMLAARDKETGDKLTDIQIIAQAQTFILAGYETTANALAFAIYLVSTHPEVQAKLLHEIDTQLAALGGPDIPLTEEALIKFEYTSAVINESLRLHPPAHVTPRSAVENLQLGQYSVPKGTPILISIMALHKDPALWEDPEAFKPERFMPGSNSVKPNAFIPFGVGGRMCIGYKFALQEAKVALIRMYSALTFALEPGQVPLQISYGITAGPKHGVWVRPLPRR